MLYHRKGKVWWVAPFLPLVFYVLYNRLRQPLESTANVYRFIIARRTGNAQMIEQKKVVDTLLNTHPRLIDLKNHLEKSKMTIYELEEKMLQNIVENKF